MNPLGDFPFVWAMLLACYGAHERQRLDRLVERSQQIVAGASEADVMAVLGPPDYRWKQGGLIFRRPRQWVYGTTIDFRKFIIPEWPIPFPIPIKLRLFQTADDEDLVIDWTSDDVVAKVSRPTGKLE